MSRTEELRDRILNPFITNVARAALLRQYACVVFEKSYSEDPHRVFALMLKYEEAARVLEEDMRGYPPGYGSLYVERISESDELFLAFK